MTAAIFQQGFYAATSGFYAARMHAAPESEKALWSGMAVGHLSAACMRNPRNMKLIMALQHQHATNSLYKKLCLNLEKS